MRRAVYAGMYDPLTNGHLWMIDQGSQLFDELIVGVGINPAKTPTFTIGERVEILDHVCASYQNVRVLPFENQYLVNFAESVDAGFILRGIRSAPDYEYERVWRYLNGDFHSDIQTVFLLPPRELVEVSSSMIKGLVGPQGWEEVLPKFVPGIVCQKMLKRFGR